MKHLILQERMKNKRTNQTSYRITIPKAIVLAFGWKKGTLISFTVEGNNKIILRRSNKQVAQKIRNLKNANESWLGYD